MVIRQVVINNDGTGGQVSKLHKYCKPLCIINTIKYLATNTSQLLFPELLGLKVFDHT